MNKANNKKRRCIVLGCTNHSDEGLFKNDLCAPCQSMLTTGEIVPSNAFFVTRYFREQRRYDKICNLIESLEKAISEA